MQKPTCYGLSLFHCLFNEKMLKTYSDLSFFLSPEVYVTICNRKTIEDGTKSREWVILSVSFTLQFDVKLWSIIFLEIMYM